MCKGQIWENLETMNFEFRRRKKRDFGNVWKNIYSPAACGNNFALIANRRRRLKGNLCAATMIKVLNKNQSSIVNIHQYNPFLYETLEYALFGPS